MPTLALIGLGSNLGDRKANLDQAVGSLSATPGLTLRAVSSYRETAPVGGPAGQGAFLNAAASLESTLSPFALLKVLHEVEAQAGRVRTVRWGERTVDVDLLLFGGEVVRTPDLYVPHPRMALRRFVLAPLAEVAPLALDPVTGRTIIDLLANLERRPGYVAIGCEPRLRWDWHAALTPSVPRPPDDPQDVARAYQGEGAVLHDRLVRALPASAVEDRITEEDLKSFWSKGFPDGSPRGVPEESAARWLDAGTVTGLAPEDGWLVSHFWFDALFLRLDALKSSRPRYLRFREEFLERRANVLAPTFVVVRPVDVDHFGLYEPRYAWHGPIGRDTPVLEVNDFHSDAALAEVLAACAASRAA